MEMLPEIEKRYPNAKHLHDYICSGDQILHWDEAKLGPRPTKEELSQPTAEDQEAEEVKALALAGGNYTMAEATKVLNFLAKRHLGIR